MQPNRESRQLSLASVVNMLQLPLYLVWLCVTEKEEEEGEKNKTQRQTITQPLYSLFVSIRDYILQFYDNVCLGWCFECLWNTITAEY